MLAQKHLIKIMYWNMLWNILKANVRDAGLSSHHCHLHFHFLLAVSFPSALSADHQVAYRCKTSNLVLFSLFHYSKVVSWPYSRAQLCPDK